MHMVLSNLVNHGRPWFTAPYARDAAENWLTRVGFIELCPEPVERGWPRRPGFSIQKTSAGFAVRQHAADPSSSTQMPLAAPPFPSAHEAIEWVAAVTPSASPLPEPAPGS